MSRKIRLFISFLILFVCISLIIIRAENVSITYDEAYTYTYIVNKIKLDSIQNTYETFIRMIHSIANNHLLNTFSIYFIESILNIKYVDLIIRFPNVICGILFYVFLSYLFVNRKIGLVYYLFSTLNFYQLQFFSLARGYSMALFFNTVSIYFFNKYVESKFQNSNFLSISLILCTIAEYANSISLLLMACYFIYVLIDFVRKKDFSYKYNIPIMIAIIFANILIMIYHFIVTANGKPLHNTKSITSLLTGYFSNNSFNMLLLIIIAIFIYSFIKNRNKSLTGGESPIQKSSIHKDYINLYLLLIFWSITILCLIIFKKGMPSTRELIPFYSLYAGAFDEIVCYISCSTIKKCSIKRIMYMSLGIYLTINFVISINVTTVNEDVWWKTTNIKEKAYAAAMNKTLVFDDLDEDEIPSMTYYRDQIYYWYNIDIYKTN